MRNVFLIIFVLTVGSCACGSIPKAGLVSKPPHTNKLELPAISESDIIVSHLGYTASYNQDWLIPNWVAYELTIEELNGEEKGEESFQWDPDIKGRQAWREDYSGSGWDKGHLIPKADLKWSAKAYSESFYFSNICPQNHTFNAGSWRITENMARRIAGRFGSVYIVCGPIVTDNKYGTIGEHRIVVPDAFFKAFLVCDSGEYSAIGMIMNNSPEKQELKACMMSVDALEEKCGFDFFHALSATVQNDVESRINWHTWGI